MKKTLLTVVVGFVGLATYILGARATPASAETMARCKVTVPQSWGDFVGASDSFGLVFKDNSGTLRFVRQLPCGLESIPSVSVEVQRN
jgi:hypothetical protein